MGRISGPLLDRIDIHIEVPAVPFNDLATSTPGTSSTEMRKQVVQAREIQAIRFDGTTTRANADVQSSGASILSTGKDRNELLRDTVTSMGLSARAHDKIIHVACTIADVDGAE